MNGIVKWLFLLFALISYTQDAFALRCSYRGGATKEMNGGVLDAVLPSFSINKQTTDLIITDMYADASCTGSTDAYWQDAIRSTSLTLSSELTSLGFTIYIKNDFGSKLPSPPDICIWPDNNCSLTNEMYVTLPIRAKIGIARPQGSGNWKTGVSIPAGTEIARMETISRSSPNYNAWNYGGATWIFRLANDMVIPAYTCSVNQFDSSVKLPDVTRNDLVAGMGRYSNANKEFKFNLSCDEGTTVSVTFDGDTMTGQDSVLVNKESGNPNVGIQVLFNNSTVVKMNEKLKIADSAVSQEIYKFNAYYFYNGGTVVGGPIRSVATFTFDYN